MPHVTTGSLTAADIPPELSKEIPTMAEAKTKAPAAPKTFAVEDVDPNTSTTFKAQLKEANFLDGTSPDRMPKPNISEADKAAILAERAAEEEEAVKAELTFETPS